MFLLAATLALAVILGGGSCRPQGESSYTEGILDDIPVPPGLARALEQSRADRRPGGPLTPDHEWRAGLDLRLDDPETHDAAVAEFFARWRREPERLLWLECVERDALLQTDPDSVAAVQALIPPRSPAAAVLAVVLAEEQSVRDSLLGDIAPESFGTEEDRLVFRLSRAMWRDPAGRSGELLDAIPSARGLGGPFFEARFWKVLGEALAAEGQLDAALHAEAYSIELYEQSSGEHWALWAGINMAEHLIEAQQPGRALIVLDRTRERARTEGAAFVEVIAIGEQSSVYVEFSEIGRALDLDIEAVRLMDRLNFRLDRTLILLNVADDYLQLAELDLARAWIDSAHVEAASTGTLEAQWAVYLDDADLSAIMGQAARADSLGQLADSQNAGLASQKHPYAIARRALHRAQRALTLGNFPVVESSLLEMERLLLEPVPRGNAEDYPLEAGLLRAQLEQEAGNRVRAYAALDSCVLRLSQVPSASGSARVLALRGQIAQDGGDPFLGLEFIHEALDSAVASHRPAIVVQQRLVLAQALLAADSVGAARAELGQVGKLLAERRGLQNLQERDYWLIRCDEADGRPADALRRARALLAQSPSLPQDLRVKTLLAVGRSEEARGVATRAREAYRTVVEETGDVNQRLETATLRYIARDALREAVEGLVRLELRDGLNRKAALASLTWRHQLQQLLDGKPIEPVAMPQQPTLILLLAPKVSTVWFVRGDTIEVRQLPGRAQLERLGQRVLDGVSRPGRQRDVAAETELGELLVEPFAGHWPPGTSLQVLADGSLRALPWDLLRLDGRSSLERGPVVQVPSLQPAVHDWPAGLGDIPALTFGRNAAAGPGRPPLAHAEAQAESVAALCAPGSRSALGDTVTVKAVIDAAARGNLLHIVLHSVAGRFSPGQTALALGQDGLLDAQRVAAESWNTPLVFLVSCETVDRRGRGLDLPRAFLAGGAGCVLASPIKVPDSSGEDFALLFYRHLREGLSADEALRRTKLDRGASPHEQADPCTWAPWQILRSAR